MKKFLLLLGVLFVGTCVFAITIGVEPPAKFMTYLKNCTPTSFKINQNGLVLTYAVKGKTPSGRCIVEFSDYTDFSNRETYNGYIAMISSLAGDKIKQAKIPTQEQMIAQAKKEKTIMVCKFSKEERQNLYDAYQLHDDNSKTTTQNPDGTVSYSFDSRGMGSYDKLMMKYSHGPCIDKSDKSLSVHACSYADTTCYVREQKEGAYAVFCTPDNDKFKRLDKVIEHARSNMCEKL